MPPYRSASSDDSSKTLLTAACKPSTGSDAGSGIPPPRLIGDSCSVRDIIIDRGRVPASVGLIAGSIAADSDSSSVTSCPPQCFAAMSARVPTSVCVKIKLRCTHYE